MVKHLTTDRNHLEVQPAAYATAQKAKKDAPNIKFRYILKTCSGTQD